MTTKEIPIYIYREAFGESKCYDHYIEILKEELLDDFDEEDAHIFWEELNYKYSH